MSKSKDPRGQRNIVNRNVPYQRQKAMDQQIKVLEHSHGIAESERANAVQNRDIQDMNTTIQATQFGIAPRAPNVVGTAEQESARLRDQNSWTTHEPQLQAAAAKRGRPKGSKKK